MELNKTQKFKVVCKNCGSTNTDILPEKDCVYLDCKDCGSGERYHSDNYVSDEEYRRRRKESDWRAEARRRYTNSRSYN